MDSQSFFIHGFSELYLDQEILQKAKDFILSRGFIAGNGDDGCDRFNWPEQPAPEINRLIEHIVETVRISLGDSIVHNKEMCWKGGETLDFHDHIGDNEIQEYHVLTYLGSNEWSKEDGGYLRLRCKLLPEIFEFSPIFGRSIILNNTHKDFQHGVSAFTNREKDRIVFQIGLTHKCLHSA